MSTITKDGPLKYSVTVGPDSRSPLGYYAIKTDITSFPGRLRGIDIRIQTPAGTVMAVSKGHMAIGRSGAIYLPGKHTTIHKEQVITRGYDTKDLAIKRAKEINRAIKTWKRKHQA